MRTVTARRGILSSITIAAVAAATLVTASPAFAVGTGSVYGQISNGSGVGVEGVHVYVNTEDYAQFYEDVTDANGNFEVTDMEPGSYSVCAMAFSLDYASTCEGGVWAYGADPKTYFSVANGSSYGRDITLPDGVHVSGRILDEDGNYVTETKIAVFAGGFADQSYPIGQTAVFSDSDGNFELKGLPAGYPIILAASVGWAGESGLAPYQNGYVTQYSGPAYSYATATPIGAVNPGDSLTGNNFTLIFPSFDDVTVPSSPFYAPIEWMYSHGISTGTPVPENKPLYKATNAVSRQAMASFLYRFAGEPAFTVPTEQTFADVAPDNQFYTAVEWMYSEGISSGTPQSSGKPLFKPLDAVSRQAMALFLTRYSGEMIAAPTEQRFADVPLESSSAAAINWMFETGISTGTPQSSGLPAYAPLSPVSRQAMAAFLFRFDAYLAPVG